MKAVLILAVLSAASGEAEKAATVVFPVYAPNPPPQDPTLLRLTRALAESLHESLDGRMRVASREERDERCPAQDGTCPNDVAVMANAERAISLALDKDLSKLTVRVYLGKTGVEREGNATCTWVQGAVECNGEELAAIFEEGAGPKPLAETEVQEAFAALEPRMERCGASRTKDAWVSFKVRADGRVYDVRLDPRELAEEKSYNCVATTLESLRMRRFSGAAQPYRFKLFEEKAKPAPKKKGKKK
jgi:hypothetical protein